jgi:hypothetical protein
LDFLENIAAARPHPVQRERSVADAFADERKRLLPLPSTSLPTDLVTSVRVDKTALVTFDTNRYSVPPELVERTLTLVANDREVRLLSGSDVVARHQRAWSRHTLIELPEHRAALMASQPRARDGKGRDRLRVHVPRIDELLHRWLEDGRNVGSLVARTLKLLELYGGSVLAEATVELLDKGSHDFGALSILCEQRRARPRAVLPIELAPHVVDRDVIPHDLGGYDDVR